MRRKDLLLLVLLVLASRLSSLPGIYLFDDVSIVQDNPVVQKCDIKKALTGPYWGKEGFGLFRPLTTLSFCANRAATGTKPWGFHLFNLCLHLANVLLLYRVIRLMGSEKEKHGVAFLGAALFATHPILVEAVNSIVGRAELWVALFVLTALIVFLQSSRNRTPLRLFWLPVLWGFALLSKEHAVVLPLLLILCWLTRFWITERSWEGLGGRIHLVVRRKETLWLATSFVFVLAVVAGWRKAVLGGQIPHVSLVEIRGAYQHVVVVCQVLGKAIERIVFPSRLQWDYSLFAITPATSFLEPFALLGLVVLLVSIVLAVWRRVWGPLLVTAWLVASLGPALQLVPIGTLFAERLLYLPLLSVVLVVCVTAAPRFAARGARVAAVAAICVVTVFAWLSHRANAYWQDELEFWKLTRARAPESIPANIGLGMAYRRHGDLKNAEHFLRASIALAPRSLAHGPLGYILFEQGRFSEAERSFERMIALSPDEPDLHDMLGLARAAQKNLKGAWPEFERARALNPSEPRYRNNLVSSLIEGRNDERAYVELQGVLRTLPHDPTANSYLLLVLYRLGKKEDFDRQIERLDTLVRTWSGAEKAFLASVLRNIHFCPVAPSPVGLRLFRLSGATAGR